MIELALDLGWADLRRFNNLGDVVVAKLAGAVWGAKEKRELIVVQRDDPALEQRLLLQQQQGNLFPMIEFPYGLSDPDGNMRLQSLWRLDTTLLPPDILLILRDPRRDKPVIFTPEIWWLQVTPPDAGFLRRMWNKWVLGYVDA